MSPRTLLPICALAAILAVGCTSENNPLSPSGSSEDTTPPAAPQGVATKTTDAGWVMSWDANGEADLAGYNIYRYDPDPSRENAYVKLNGGPITSTSFGLPLEPGDWIYRVRAVDATGNQSGMSAIASVTMGEAIGIGIGNDEIQRGL